MRAKKSLGQNFLSHKGVLRAMVHAARIQPGTFVVEIGPGKGSLTRELLAAGAKVTAIEKDSRLIPLLEMTFEKEIAEGNLSIIHDDILLLGEGFLPKEDFIVVANIPYYITGQIFRLFLEAEHKPKSIVLMTQKEVADRVVARDGKESVLSLSVKLFGKPKIIQKVQKELFSPKPKVDSAILLIDEITRETISAQEKEVFFALVKTAFNQKRKTVGKSLKQFLEKNPEMFTKSQIDPKDRPEDIPLSKWLSIVRLFQHEP